MSLLKNYLISRAVSNSAIRNHERQNHWDADEEIDPDLQLTPSEIRKYKAGMRDYEKIQKSYDSGIYETVANDRIIDHSSTKYPTAYILDDAMRKRIAEGELDSEAVEKAILEGKEKNIDENNSAARQSR